MRGLSSILTAICTIVYTTGGAFAANGKLEDLVDTKIYTASKKEEDVYSTASAIYVITEDDLKQLGARHVADALRSVPGLQVAKITSNKWMVASRGFGEQFSNKLLVLLDGRPLYNSLFSGVLWFQQDIPISDIKQIEVIRGPGATLWGSNAVNGVINIITKNTHETIGDSISTTFGLTETNEYQAIIEASHGQTMKSGGATRTTLKLRQDPSYESVRNLPYDDSWGGGSLNFRYDSEANTEKALTLTASIFQNKSDQIYTYPLLVAPFSERVEGSEAAKGGHIYGEFTKDLDSKRSITTRSYIDYTDWDYAGYNPSYLDAGLETQYNFSLLENWNTVLGGGYRTTIDSIENSAYLINTPDKFDAHFFDAFVQTEIPLIDRELTATVGSKVESNTYDSFALSPNVKLSWRPQPLFMMWASWARANRIPSRNTYHLTSYTAGTPGGYVALIPSEDFKPETSESFEAGVRINPIEGLQIDTAAFLSSYDHLRTFLPGPPIGAPVGTALYISNSGYANNRGIEVSATYQTTPSLKLQGSYSFHDLNFKADPGLVDPVYLNSGDKWAKHTFTARAAYSVHEDITLNATGYYYSSQPAMRVPAYTKLDANINWAVASNLDVVAGVDNLADNLHQEYSAQLFGEPTEVPRLLYVTVKMGL